MLQKTHIRQFYFLSLCACVVVCMWLYLSVRVELALMLPGEAMQPQHVVQLLP